MPIQLPTTKLAPTYIDPQCLLLYGLPKIAKTTILSLLPECLLLDIESGSNFIAAMRVKVVGLRPPLGETEEARELRYSGVKNKEGNLEYPVYLTEVITELRKKNPYKFLALDTVSTFEDWCEVEATTNYMDSVIGKTFNRYDKDHPDVLSGKVKEGELLPKAKQASVLSLANGGGYLYHRNTMEKWLGFLKSLDSSLILTAHLRYLTRNDKVGKETDVKDIDLTGKIKRLVAGQFADALGYVYRRGNKAYISFEPVDDILAGVRSNRLEGRHIMISEKLENGEVVAYWKEIYQSLAK